MLKILILITIVLFASFVQIFLKTAMNELVYNKNIIVNAINALTNSNLIYGIILYIVTSLLWLYTIKDMPLSKAYPFLALTFVLVPILSKIFFQEHVGITQLLGMIIIVVGVLLVFNG